MPFFIIDDVYGDSRLGPDSGTAAPDYMPVAVNWDVVGGTCHDCTPEAHFITPIDASQVQNEMWHTVTMNPGEPLTTVSVKFTGTFRSSGLH